MNVRFTLLLVAGSFSYVMAQSNPQKPSPFGYEAEVAKRTTSREQPATPKNTRAKSASQKESPKETKESLKEKNATPARIQANSTPTVPPAAQQSGSAARMKPAVTAPVQAEQTGTASFYGQAEDGRQTSSGKPFDNGQLTAAHPTFPFGSRLRVTHLDSGRSVMVTVTDRGSFRGGRIISVSRRAAEELGFVKAGTARVKVELLNGDDKQGL